MSRVRVVGRTAGATVPRYHLYGETASGTGDWFVNVEPLADRCRANGWRIEPTAIRNLVKSYSCAAAEVS